VVVGCSTLEPVDGRLEDGRGGAASDWPGSFHSARGGTLFLDEIGDLPPASQAELLRALQQGAAQDVRLVAAAHPDLPERAAAGELRRDLYACVAPWALRVPPLRERRGDLLTWIEQLHTAWLERRPGRPVDTLSLTPEAVERLLLHPWHANLRELERLVHELASEPELPRPIPLPRLPAWILGGTPDVPTQPVSGPPVPRASSRAAMPSRKELAAVLEQLGGSLRAAAEHFGRDRRQIERWIEIHGLPRLWVERD
jgi:transcriptional regulator with GAF, ATPase, and Fis domain